MHKHFQKHKKILAELNENYDDISQEIKLFHNYLSMIETQCEQIASSYQIFLCDDKDIPASTNVVTRRGAVVIGPLGPPEYEAEKERKEKALLKASQEDDTLVDPRDETETQDQTKEDQNDA